MSEMEAALLSLGEVADTKPETLPATTPPDFRFRYIDLSSVGAGFINWGAVSETTYGGAPSRARRVVQPKDILYGTVRPNLQSHGFISVGQLGPLVASTGFSVIRAKSGLSHPAYLFHSLMSCSVTAQAVRNAVGSSYPALNDSDVKRFQLFVPPYQEQEVAAQILDTLDTAIRATEALIDKLKAVKQGLLHDLLTRGIDANGQLRPPQSEAPQLYKESPLGWIPREWEEVTLGEIASRGGGLLQTGPFGSQLHAHEYVVDGIPVIMPQDMVGSELSVENIARITQCKAVALSRHRVRPNDLIFSRRGDLSRCVTIEDAHEGWLCGTGCLLARLKADEINGYWLSLVYQQPGIQSQVMGRAVGSTMANLNTSILAAITIARPVISEQNEIALRLKSAVQRIAGEERLLVKMQLEKSGLMDDLLTGRVRVTPLLETVQQAAVQTGA